MLSVRTVYVLSSPHLLQDRNITTIFDATGLLLILGEPGSGKTTTMLELTANLLARAKADAKERVPFVLNLSSWKKKQPLAEWIAAELSEKYRVPSKIARSWLQNDYLVSLLDGLDEVPTALQPDCVAAINDFIDGSEPSGLVVCCRLMEYQWLPKRLKLNGAICLEPLTPEEVSKYLAEGGPKLAALREAVNTDPVLQEFAQAPLMLSIMSLACQGADGNELASQKGDLPEVRRKQIFGLYVEQMFQRKGTASLVFPKEKTIGWLSWLAGKMRENSQSVFLVEGLQPSWLGTRAKRVPYGTVAALTLGLIFALTGGLICVVLEWLNDLFGNSANPLIIPPIVGLIGGLICGLIGGFSCWSESPLKNGVMCGSIAGLIAGLIVMLIGVISGSIVGGLGSGLGSGLEVGLIVGLGVGLIVGLTAGLGGAGSLNHITLVETISWKWNQFWKGTIPGLIVALIIGLGVGLIGGLTGGLILGVIFGLVSGLVNGMTDRVKVGKAFPNEGIKLSGKNSLAV